MPQIIEATGIGRPPIGQPHLAALTALPGAGCKAQNFGLHAATLERARKYVGTDCGNGNRPPTHRTRIVDQQRDDRVLELGIALHLVAKCVTGADDHPRQTRGIEQAFFLVEIPAAVLLRHEAAL